MLTRTIADHIATSAGRDLPPDVAAKTALHLLDTVAAMVSGSRLSAGRAAIRFIETQGGAPRATVMGCGVRTTVADAAHANGMMAHADETDDSHAPSLTHPGCAVVPAALAFAEATDCPGPVLLRAVATGYDVGTRISMALGGGRFFDRHHSSHAFGGLFGATAACAVVAGLDTARVAHAIAYAVQMASGNTCWRRDPNHVEKAFIFGGMPARNGVLAVAMAEAGFGGSPEPLEGTPGLFAAFPDDARPELAIEDLGQRFEIMRTSIKKWCVGSPMQSALDSLEGLVREHGFDGDAVAEIVVELPRRRAAVVQNRTSPDLNIAHQMAVLLIDGTLTFATTHDAGRLGDPDAFRLRERVRVVPHDGDPAGQAVVRVRLTDGRTFQRQTLHVRGTPGNPMNPEEVVAKARDLLDPVIGRKHATAACDIILGMAAVERASDLISILA